MDTSVKALFMKHYGGFRMTTVRGSRPPGSDDAPSNLGIALKNNPDEATVKQIEFFIRAGLKERGADVVKPFGKMSANGAYSYDEAVPGHGGGTGVAFGISGDNVGPARATDFMFGLEKEIGFKYEKRVDAAPATKASAMHRASPVA